MKKIVVAKGQTLRDSFLNGYDLWVELAAGARADILIASGGEGESVVVHARENSVLNISMLDVSGGDFRRDIEIFLHGRGAECNLNGVFITNGDDKCANFVKMNHLAEGCNSNQNFRGVAAGSSYGFFRGYIYVDPAAQETVALQQNHNVVLSSRAKIETQPQLEIYADRVKCNHGATVGRQDETAMFYARQRGISTAAARAMLLDGFCRSALPIEGFDTDIQDIVYGKLAAKLSEL